MYEKIRPHLIPLLLLAVATLLVYGRVRGHDFQVTWDDDRYVIENPMVHGLSIKHVMQAFSGQYFGNYAPLHLISYMLDFELWKLWPGGYLLTNLFLHLVNGMLVYRLFVALHGERVIALVGAAVFLLHPLQVESVAWVSQRKNLLAMLFFLLAWECYRRYRDTDGNRRLWNYLFSVILFTCAILSKSVAVIFPVIILLYDYCFPATAHPPQSPFGKGGRLVVILDKIPYILVAGAAAVITVMSQAPVGDNWDGAGGGRVDYHGGSPLATFYSMLPVFCRYLGLLAWPKGLNAKYDTAVYTSVNSTVLLAAVALAVVGWLCYRLFRYDRRLGFWALLFWVGFVPVSQIVPLVTLMNDRYVYFPMLGAAALVGVACRYAKEHAPVRLVPLLYGVIAILLTSLSIASFQRVGVWKNSVLLWQDSVSKLSGPAVPWASLAQAYERTGNGMVPEAIDAFKHALEIEPANEYALYGLGRLYGILGDYERASGYVSALLKQSPNHVMGVFMLGTIYEKQGKYDLAEQTFRRAEALQPEAVEIAMELANLAILKGDMTTAYRRYMQIEARGDNFPITAYILSWLELRLGNEELALSWLEKALQRGYADYRSMDDLEELKELRGNPRFEELLRRYGKERN
jgi:tetratricopeptide (TPR) repeat protein